MDILISCIIGCVVAVAVVFFLLKKKQHGKKSIGIESTQNVIVSIREIAELTTASFFCETIVTEKKRRKVADNGLGNLIDKIGITPVNDAINDELCLIVNGIVRARYDLKKIKSEDFQYAEGKLTIVLPPVEILDVIANPKQWTFYTEEGCWTEDEEKSAKSKGVQEIRNEALKANLLERASINGKKQIRALFLGLGYKDIELLQQELPAQCAIQETSENLAIEQ